MTAAVLCLCFQAMLADDYRVREYGSHVAAALLRSRPSRCHAIVTAAAHHPNAEVRSRCGRLVPRYRAHLAAAYVPSGVCCWPCLDMHDGAPDRWAFVGEWRCRAGSFAASSGRSGPPHWWDYRRATELWIRAEIAEGLSYADADAVLARMWSRELDYHATGYAQWLPVVWGWQRVGWDGGYPD